MGILSRHFLARFLRAFAAILVILALAVTVVDTLLELDDLIESTSGLRDAGLRILLRLPSLHLAYLVPASAFLAAFVSLGGAARRSEIVALKAGGISPLRLAVPLLVAAAGLSLAVLAVNETLSVQASHALRRLTGADAAEVAFRRDSFWYHRGRFVYNVEDADPESRVLRQVTVFELDERGRLVRSLHAARAEITEEGDWRLDRATIRRFDPARPEAAAEFEQVAEVRVALSSEPDLTLLEARVSELTIRDLREFLEARPAGGIGVGRARALLAERATEPWIVLLFALLAIPLGLRVERSRSYALPALQGVALLFLFYLVRDYGATLAVGGVTPPVATHVAVFAAFAGFGLWQLARVPR